MSEIGHDDASITNDPSDAVAGIPGMSVDTEPARPEPETGKRRLTGDFSYSWSNLSAEVPVKNRRWKCWKERPELAAVKHIPIIRSLSGVCKSGELWALMGGSGAGKTTLLNTLNFRNQRQVKVSGDRCINGVPIGPEVMSAVSGYLQQDDLLPNALSCREHLMFSATLRLPRGMSMKQRAQRVDEALRDVGLWHVKDVYIGGILSKGISGGEKKRLTFASEILTDPSILFCDEPTSGLDSFMAKMLVDILKKMAGRGKLVICTIHQPSTEVFKSFDHLYFLTEGRLAYSGDRLGALKFFSNLGYECPATYNPADYYIQTLAIVPDHAEECRHRCNEISLAFARSEDYEELRNELKKLSDNAPQMEQLIKGVQKSSKYEASCFVQFSTLFVRFCRFQFRDPSSFLGQTFMFACLGLFLGLSVLQVELDLPGVGSVTGIIMVAMLIQMILPTYVIASTLPDEIPLLMREHWNGMYSLVSCYMGRSLQEIIGFTALTFFFFPIVYYIAGLSGPVWRLGYHMITMCICSNIGAAAGVAVSYLSGSVQLAVINSILTMVPFLLFCGFFVDDKNLPTPLNYLRYLSSDFYALENLLAIQWEGVDHVQDGLGLLTTGKEVLKFYDYENHFLRNSCVLLLIWGIYRVIALLVFTLRGRR
ncbi:unnamed protein product [Allacma fusca]|uniref:ABC transporter domain-containing protein n=1 Tax=Allacma fusca TaxID=39272 RepID=A0A8J2KFK1_9HEXA|nr:unnamed protein product [Allacma fusca]